MRGRTTPQGATQKEMILGYMRQHGGITQLEATRELGCTRLGARIWELIHKDGYLIRAEMVAVKNRFGQTTTVKRYWLAEEPKGGPGVAGRLPALHRGGSNDPARKEAAECTG